MSHDIALALAVEGGIVAFYFLTKLVGGIRGTN